MPLRCQATTVSGLTIIRTERQSAQTRDNHTQRIRSPVVNFGRFLAERLSTPIWCRSARFSNWRAARVLNSEDSMVINAGTMPKNGRGSRRRIRNTHDLREFGIYDRQEALAIVKPETFFKRQRTAFRIFWRWKSRRRGRPPLPNNLKELIREMDRDNPNWGEERIADELLLKLGIRAHPERFESIWMWTGLAGGAPANAGRRLSGTMPR